jgi:Tol biopolymer transport system component
MHASLVRRPTLAAGLSGFATFVFNAVALAQSSDPAIAFVAQYSTGNGNNTMTVTDRTVMNADGSNQAVVWSRTLDLALTSFLELSWSPDLDGIAGNGYQGTLAAVARDINPTRYNLYLLDIVVVNGAAQATNIRLLVDCAVDPNVASSATHPAWSPDLDALAPGYQGEIAFTGSTDNGQTSSVDVIQMAWNGATVEPLFGPNSSVPLWDPHLSATPRYPTWSPDGARIAFAHSNQLWVMEAQTGVVTAVIAGFSDTPSELEWSRTSSRVALRLPGPQIYIVDVDQGLGSLQAVPGVPGGSRWPTWSPDDTSIVFAGKNAGNKAKWHIRKVVLATGEQMVLASSTTKNLMAPDWRPF